MTITRLTLFSPLLYFGRCLWLGHGMVLRRLSFRDHGLRWDHWLGPASWGCYHGTINDTSADTIRVADQDTIVEKHEEGVGVSVGRWMRSAMSLRYWWESEASKILTTSRERKCCRAGNLYPKSYQMMPMTSRSRIHTGTNTSSSTMFDTSI